MLALLQDHNAHATTGQIDEPRGGGGWPSGIGEGAGPANWAGSGGVSGTTTSGRDATSTVDRRGRRFATRPGVSNDQHGQEPLIREPEGVNSWRRGGLLHGESHAVTLRPRTMSRGDHAS